MNISQYNEAMDEIQADEIGMEELIKRKNKIMRKKRQVKFVAFCAVLCILVFSIRPFIGILGDDTEIYIKVYAAENEVQLDKDFISFNLNASGTNGGDDLDHCYMNYNLNFNCEGDNIDTITYTCNEKKITKMNRLHASAYYVENLVTPSNELSAQMKDNNFLYSYIIEIDSTAHITKLIGSSYTVTYDEQNNKQYGLIVGGNLDQDGNYQFDDTIIKVDIKLKDGTVKHKKILMKSSEASSYTIKMRIL